MKAFTKAREESPLIWAITLVHLITAAAFKSQHV
jgi:hypothetical protein